VPGEILLDDGRRLRARLEDGAPDRPPPRGPCDVELDPATAEETLSVRFACGGDRFHPLGAPGSKPLRRFLADAGVAREERGRVPLVLAGGEIAWVAGVRPAERRRLRGPSGVRLRLSLDHALRACDDEDAPATAPALAAGQVDLFADVAPLAPAR
jgi:tRNA(Ile)-lysidine synthetase-like protein